MSEYIMDPGARLEVGPHGRLLESLGCACGPSSVGAAPAPKGATTTKVPTKTAPAPSASSAAATLAALSRAGVTTKTAASTKAAIAAMATPSRLPWILAGVGVLGLGVVLVLRRRKKR